MVGDSITTTGPEGTVQEVIVSVDDEKITTDAGRTYDLYDSDGRPLGFQIVRPDGSTYLI